MDLVSVIVPIYNVEKYIYKCVDSIVHQDYPALEIILVNDGSTDNSLDVLKAISTTDSRIKVINQSNRGVSSARNAGINVCTGKYLMFVDGDDFVEPHYVSYFVKLIQSLNADMGISYNSFGENYRNVENHESQVSAVTAMKEMYLNKINVAVWNKIYKHEYINRYGIRFNEEFWFAEGMTFNIEYIQRCKSIATCYLPLYHQVANPESAVRKFRLESRHCGQKALRYQKKHWIIHDQRIEDAWAYHLRTYNGSIWGGLLVTGLAKDNPEEIDKCKRGFRKNLMSCLRTDIPVKRKIKCLIEFVCPTLIYH